METEREAKPQQHGAQQDKEAVKHPEGGHLFTQVDNAHAAGLGAMGRNDEKLPTGEEEEQAPQDPAY